MADQLAGATDTGRIRDNNEDAFLAEYASDSNFILAAVIDGVGGYQGGEIAADLAKEALHSLLPEIGSVDAGQLTRTFEEANTKIFEAKGTGPYQQMACVLTAAIVDRKENKAVYAHLGDTRIYLFRDGSLVKLSRDHSFVGLLEDTGRITEQEAINHPKRNEINKALGFEAHWSAADYIETGETPFLPGDLLLLCSDGLTDMLSSQEIIDVLQTSATLDNKVFTLIAAANEKGGKDNITVVLVLNDKQRVQQEAVKGQTTVFPTSAPEIILAQKAPKKEEAIPKKKSSKYLLPILLLLVLGPALFMIFLKKEDPKEEVSSPIPAVVFGDTLARAVDSMYLNPAAFGDTIHFDRTLWIQQDTLVLFGTGQTVLINDSDTSSLQIAPSVEFLGFADLELNNIKIEISASRYNSLYFKNVRLKNVRIGVGEGLLIKDSLFSGNFSELEGKRTKTNVEPQ